jgi:CheY-like chemotaxis protein
VIRTVLLVDDEPDLRRIAALSLSRVGKWAVLLAASGAEALAVIERERPDVILLDVMMPGLDGPSTLSRLRAAPSAAGVPVIFMTAKVQKQEVERYLRLGAAGVITKPFDPMRLPEQIRAIVEAA